VLAATVCRFDEKPPELRIAGAALTGNAKHKEVWQ
jgi:hypothetical protein